jgi:peptidoglycan/LPS O-acetylase OafA/YrhL
LPARRHLAAGSARSRKGSVAPGIGWGFAPPIRGGDEPVNDDRNRKAYLDGLRGVAACAVFLAHLSIALSVRNYLNANAAVCIFFVLSGFVLSELAQHSPLSFPAQAVRRYLRLVVPMLATSTFAWALLAAGFYRNQQAAALLNSWWLGNWYKFDPSFRDMLIETLYGVFVTGHSDYNCNLWTMRPELIGSLYVFVINATATSRRLRLLCYIALALFYADNYVLLFPVGALLHDFHPEMAAALKRTWPKAVAFVAGSILCVIPMKWLQMLPFVSGVTDEMYWHMIGASLVVFAVLHWRTLKLLLGSALGRLLGRLSFVLYLIHVPIICSFTAWLVLALPVGYAVPVAGVATIVLVFAASIATYRAVDQIPTRWSRAAGYAVDNLVAARGAPEPALRP